MERRLQKIIKFILIAIVAVAVFGFAVKGLWNWLAPPLFGWHAITFWQAIGLLILCKILFGGFRGGPARRMRWRGRMKEKWASMSPEEREKFRRGMGRCFDGRSAWAPAEKAEL
jgi:hypothetical protein